MKLRVFNLNCWLLPPPLSIQNTARIKKIVNMIRSYEPDIVTLQEVWLSRYTKMFTKALPEFKFITAGTRILNKSGLLTGTKKASNEHKTNFFKILPGFNYIERIARKGYHEIRINNNFSVVNTHLYAPTKPAEKLFTVSQFKYLHNCLTSESLVISGDINIDEPELRMINHSFKYDRREGNTVSKENPLTRIRFNKYGIPEQKVDYLLCPKNRNFQVETHYEKEIIVSDHYALLSNLKIN
ncbi:hypothetical protein GF389_02470 [Candidatus Dojkabacteria bacterium]|nr:hypothetical protein [Candidatus Dojkabacteria bacterium]